MRRITFRTGGGFAPLPGLSKPVTIDAAALPADTAAELRRLLEAARFFSLPPRVGGQRDAADYQTYTIDVEAEDRRHAVRVSEPVADPHLRALVDRLRLLAAEKNRAR